MAYNIPLRIRNLIRRAGTSDPYAIAEYLGIKVKAVDTPTHINGFWKRILRRKFIFVNERLDEWQQKAVIAHEIGHIMLHPKYRYFCLDSRTYYSATRHENEADSFSVELLKAACPDIESEYVDLFLKEGWKR